VSWALWLAIPVVVTLLAAVLSWLRSRTARALDTDEAMRAHGEYLEALAQTARSKDRGPLARPPD
jgi:cytochrome c-type biogenesis protein CcmH/NrfF